VAPTGRAYTFPRADVAHREWFWRPKILNYPVQGLGADLVAIGRVTMWKRLRRDQIPVLFQSTVHDSIDIDCEACYNSRVVEIVKQSIIDIPTNFYRLFGVEFDLPLNSEVSVGPNLKDQQKV
jgi:DNA polymerase I-like protein with 3'-5' exonuclease and polymerase domains